MSVIRSAYAVEIPARNEIMKKSRETLVPLRNAICFLIKHKFHVHDESAKFLNRDSDAHCRVRSSITHLEVTYCGFHLRG
jgi:hypothetical protein